MRLNLTMYYNIICCDVCPVRSCHTKEGSQVRPRRKCFTFYLYINASGAQLKKKMFYLELLGTKDGALEGNFLHLQLQGLETGWPAGKALSFLALILLSHPFVLKYLGDV